MRSATYTVWYHGAQVNKNLRTYSGAALPLARILTGEGCSPAGRIGDRSSDIGDAELEAIHQSTEVEILGDDTLQVASSSSHGCKREFTSA